MNSWQGVVKKEKEVDIYVVAFMGCAIPLTTSVEWLRYFNDLAVVGDRCSRMLLAGGCGGGMNAPDAKSLK